MVDRYTKAVLTVIAISLSAIAIEQAAPRAVAQENSVGTSGNPAHVEIDSVGGAYIPYNGSLPVHMQ